MVSSANKTVFFSRPLLSQSNQARLAFYQALRRSSQALFPIFNHAENDPLRFNATLVGHTATSGLSRPVDCDSTLFRLEESRIISNRRSRFCSELYERSSSKKGQRKVLFVRLKSFSRMRFFFSPFFIVLYRIIFADGFRRALIIIFFLLRPALPLVFSLLNVIEIEGFETASNHGRFSIH